jgi:hypothetical protein
MTSKLFIIFSIVFLFACKNKTETKSNNKVDTTKPAIVGQIKEEVYNSNMRDTIPIDDNIYLVGDSSKHPEKSINYVAVKFKPYIRFSDFPVDTYEAKKKAAINYSSNVTARQFKTIITNTYNNEGLNFGGHYCFVEWGCGSPCQSSAIVDLKTGIVYDGPSAGYGYDYKKNSRMLMVNPSTSGEFYWNCVACEPEIFIWNERTKQFEQR